MKSFHPLLRRLAAGLCALAALALAAPSAVLAQQAPASVDPAVIAQMQAEIADLKVRVTRQEDTEAIRKLLFTYGYFMDNAMYDQVLSLMSDHIVSCEIGGYGVYLGKAGCTRLWIGVMGKYYGGGTGHLAFGQLVKHYLIKDVITLSPDGQTATARVDYLGLGGAFQGQGNPAFTRQNGGKSAPGFQLGVYSLEFVKEDGVWKIGKFWLHFDTTGFLAPDWESNPGYRCDNKQVPPDQPTTMYHPFPEVARVPFQYPNPVTGQAIPPYVGPDHYWIGNWPGEFGKDCGHH